MQKSLMLISNVHSSTMIGDLLCLPQRQGVGMREDEHCTKFDLCAFLSTFGRYYDDLTNSARPYKATRYQSEKRFRDRFSHPS